MVDQAWTSSGNQRGGPIASSGRHQCAFSHERGGRLFSFTEAIEPQLCLGRGCRCWPSWPFVTSTGKRASEYQNTTKPRLLPAHSWSDWKELQGWDTRLPPFQTKCSKQGAHIRVGLAFSILFYLPGSRHSCCAPETADLRHHQRAGRYWSDREEIQEQHPVEVSRDVWEGRSAGRVG